MRVRQLSLPLLVKLGTSIKCAGEVGIWLKKIPGLDLLTISLESLDGLKGVNTEEKVNLL